MDSSCFVSLYMDRSVSESLNFQTNNGIVPGAWRARNPHVEVTPASAARFQGTKGVLVSHFSIAETENRCSASSGNHSLRGGDAMTKQPSESTGFGRPKGQPAHS